MPGKYTTANLLFSIAWPDVINKVEYLFSGIEDALLKDEVDAGLIIHETRFTYYKRGLHKLADMGEYWENLTGLPIPLGAIVIKRSIPDDIAQKVNRIIRRSLEYAYKDSFASYDFVAGNAKEMDSTVMNNHIKLYVNEYTLNLGIRGREAVVELFRIAGEKGVIPVLPDRIFLTSL
jgi:1,4-dihydroxy-6-naphthoate synthase